MPQFFDETKERLILKAEDVSRTLVYEASHVRSSAKRRWKRVVTKKRMFKLKLMQLLGIPEREYYYAPYRSPEVLQAMAFDLRYGFLSPGEIHANPNGIIPPFSQYPPNSLKNPESIFNRSYCREPCPSQPSNMMYSPSGNRSCNPYMKNFRQELVCPKRKDKHQKSDYHKPKKSDSDKPKAKPNNAVYDNRQRSRPSDKKSCRYHKQKLKSISSVSGHKLESMSSIESSEKRSFESFKSAVTSETDTTQVSIETEAKTITEKKYFYVAAAQPVPKIVIKAEHTKKDAAEVSKMLVAAETVAEIGIADELFKEKGPKEAPKEANQEVTKMETTKIESDKAVSSSRESKLSIADRIATLGAKLVQANDRSTKRTIPRIRVDVAKEIAKVERISKVVEHKPVTKVETKDSQNSTDLLQEIDSKVHVQAADEYAISRSEDLKENIKTTQSTQKDAPKDTPKDVEQTIPEPATELSFKHLDANARTQRFNIHYKEYFADREKRIAIHKKRGYSIDALFTRAHGDYLGDVYGRQIEKIGIDSSARDFLAKKLLEECKSVQFLNRELTKCELEELREAILFCNNQFYEGIHPQVIKDDFSQILFRSPLISLYYYIREYQEFDQWLCCQIEESKLLLEFWCSLK